MPEASPLPVTRTHQAPPPARAGEHGPPGPGGHPGRRGDLPPGRGGGRLSHGRAHRLRAGGLRSLSERIAPGQWDYARRPSKKELAKTSLLALPLTEASVKIRRGPPDNSNSRTRPSPVWAGVLPLAAAWQDPAPDPVLPPHIAALARRPVG